MKITVKELRQIIREEVRKQTIQEGILDSLFNAFKKAVQGAKEWAGKKGISFNIRVPNDDEYKMVEKMLKKVKGIGVDKVTGNIYAADGDYEYIISSKGKILSKVEGFGI